MYDNVLSEATRINKQQHVNEVRTSLGNLTKKIQNWEKQYYGYER
jgi:hypothetical protein